MTDPLTGPSTLVRISGVADILGGLSRQAATAHTQKDDFPKPAYVDAQGRIWIRADVEAYAAARKPATTGEEGT